MKLVNLFSMIISVHSFLIRTSYMPISLLRASEIEENDEEEDECEDLQM
jgi:hypothetical protein